MQFSVYFWNGHHTFITSDSYEAALEEAKKIAREMNSAVDYLLQMA